MTRKPKRALGPEPAATSFQQELKLGPPIPPLEKIEETIRRLKEELSHWQKIRRAKLGGMARAKLPRKRKRTDAEIWEAFDARNRPGYSNYGLKKQLAAELGINPRTFQRAMARRKK